MYIGGTTPHNAIYGRPPHLLPDINAPIEDVALGTTRRAQHMREMSVQVMVEGASQARAKRALGTQARPAGQSHDHKIADLVDFLRAHPSKDNSGRKGPAKVVDNTVNPRGTLIVRYQRDLPKYSIWTSWCFSLHHTLLWTPAWRNGHTSEPLWTHDQQGRCCTSAWSSHLNDGVLRRLRPKQKPRCGQS